MYFKKLDIKIDIPNYEVGKKQLEYGIDIDNKFNGLWYSDLKITEQIAVLLPVIRAGSNDVSEKEVGEMVYQAGIADTLKAIGDVVTIVMSAGQDEGNVQEVVE